MDKIAFASFWARTSATSPQLAKPFLAHLGASIKVERGVEHLKIGSI